MTTQNADTSQEKSARPECPFDLPLQPSTQHGDDIKDASNHTVVILFGKDDEPLTLAQRDYVIRAVNSYSCTLAALKAVSGLFNDNDPSPFYVKKLFAPITNADQKRIDDVFIAVEAATAKAEKP